jgi:hypothetical protein
VVSKPVLAAGIHRPARVLKPVLERIARPLEETVNKIVLGLALGGVLGILDGLTALISGPEVAPMIVSIVIGSTMKGLIVGVLAGWFANRVNSLPAGILAGLGLGAFFAFLVAAMPNPEGKHYYFEIIIPGSIVGLIVGYATQRYGRRPAGRPAA